MRLVFRPMPMPFNIPEAIFFLLQLTRTRQLEQTTPIFTMLTTLHSKELLPVPVPSVAVLLWILSAGFVRPAYAPIHARIVIKNCYQVLHRGHHSQRLAQSRIA